MRLPLGLPLAGPTLPRVGYRLKRPSLVGRPDWQAELFAGLVGLLDQLFLGADVRQDVVLFICKGAWWVNLAVGHPILLSAEITGQYTRSDHLWQ
jgi:hypothetical protein